MLQDKFMAFYKGTPSEQGAQICFNNLSVALNQLGIYSTLVMVGALATVRVEVGRSFRPVLENSSGSQYEGRVDLGNTRMGDGVKYKGRGYIQITGKANYAHYGSILGVDLLNNPNLALDPVLSAKILAQYFKENGVDYACNQKNWNKVRQLVNGGTNGLDLFISIINQYLK